MTPTQLAERLNTRVEAVCKTLYPNGKRLGHEWVVGNTDGAAGDSLKICLTGTKIGVWADFATGESGGDLLDLWCVARDVNLKQAMNEAAGWLGIAQDARESQPKKTYRRPDRPHEIRGIDPNGPVMAYLRSRGLTEVTIKAYRLAEQPGRLRFPRLEQNPGVIVFPYLRNGDLINCKFLALERPGGKKQTMLEGGAEPCLFGWQAVPANTRTITITEGEIDAMTLWQQGIPAMSVPMGGGSGHKQDWIESDYDDLSRFDTINVAMDRDGPGQEAAAEIIRRLGAERCRLVEWPEPYKDANECLTVGHFTAAEFARCIHSARSLDPDELKPASAYIGAVLHEFYPAPDTPVGLATPWAKVGDHLLFRPGEVTVWAGYSGHGKALSLDTPIPTIDGWKTMGEIQIGDRVFDEKGNPCRVVALSEVWHDRPCYQVIFSDGEIIVADANHEWLTWNGRARQTYYHAKKNNRIADRPLKKCGTDQRHKAHRPSIVTTSQIAETLIEIMGSRVCNNHSIPVAGSLKAPKRKLPIDPYVFGLWLGDGDSYGGGFTTADTELLCAFSDAGFEVTNRIGKYHYGIRGLNTVLRTFGAYNNKHIPNIYLRASYGQRLALLQGLMDTDGHITNYGRCEFCAMNKALAYQVIELVLSMGLQARLITGDARLNGKFCGVKYRVTFTPDIPVFRLKRKAKWLHSEISDRIKRRYIVACKPTDSVLVRCIQVDSESHLYLAGRSMIPTHNSLVLNHVAAAGLARREKFCIASMEMLPARTLFRLVRQLTGMEKPTAGYIRHCMDWLSDKLWLFDLLGTAKTDRMLEVFAYAARRYQIRHYLVDSIAKCGLAEDDYNGQKALVERLVDFAHRYQAHVHLVSHTRKGADERTPPGKMDVKGTGAITDMVDNVITVWRNKPKETARAQAEAEGTAFANDKPDAALIVSKQRHSGWEGEIWLWFEPESLQYQLQGQPAQRYVDYIAV